MEHYGDRSVIGKILWQDTIPQSYAYRSPMSYGSGAAPMSDVTATTLRIDRVRL